jgi:phosphotriesterase-related protein
VWSSATIVTLCQQGYADQIVLSHDYNTHIDWFPPDVFATIRQTPQVGFHYLPRVVLPALREHSVTESQIAQMTTGNPKRLFDAHNAY